MRMTLPFSEWPATDQQMWHDLQRQGGPFDDRGALSHLRQTSLDTYQSAYERWLGWLRQENVAALDAHPVERATVPRLKAWLASMITLNPASVAMFLRGALRVLQAAGPNNDWSAHKRVGRGLQSAVGRGTPERKQGRILSSRVLLEAGLRHAGPEAAAATTPLGRAKAQRDGTMVAMLAAMPIRRRSFTLLKIGESLLIKNGAIIVALSEDMTKNGVAWEATLPEPAAAVLRDYITHTRPFLRNGSNQHNDFLWVGNHGAPMSISYMAKKIPGITKRLTGISIPQHFFRDSAATTLARESPKAAFLISSVLGHATSGIAETHYIQAGSVEAGRDYASVIKKLKENR